MEAEIEHPLEQTLPIGVSYNGAYHKDITFLPTNGIAEKIFTDKLPEKPYTWMGNVLSIALGSIGDVPVGSKVREEYMRTKSVTTPPIIKALPLADVNTLLVMTHRTVWENLIKRQEQICKYCGKKQVIDIDLNRITLDEEDEVTLAEKEEWHDIICNLPKGYAFKAFGKGDAKMYENYDGINFNRFVFRIPTLQDAIKNEKYVDDTISFWRRIGFDCLQNIQSVAEDGTLLEELPSEAKTQLGIRLFDYELNSKDLKAIRTSLREALPTMPFSYEEECMSCKRLTPFSLEASGFFSE